MASNPNNNENNSGLSNIFISQLLAAEARGREKIAESRRRRDMILGKLKEDLEQDMIEFETKLKEYFADYEKRFMQMTELDMKIKCDNSEKLRELDKRVQEHTDKVVAVILDKVADVKPLLNPNFRHSHL